MGTKNVTHVTPPGGMRVRMIRMLSLHNTGTVAWIHAGPFVAHNALRGLYWDALFMLTEWGRRGMIPPVTRQGFAPGDPTKQRCRSQEEWRYRRWKKGGDPSDPDRSRSGNSSKFR